MAAIICNKFKFPKLVLAALYFNNSDFVIAVALICNTGPYL